MNKIILALSLSILVICSGVGIVNAQDSACNCYCGNEGVGSELIGLADSESDCSTVCESQGDTHVSCSAETETTPLANPLCWNKEECEETNGVWADEQPAECEAGYHYCYPEPEDISLGVSIGGVETVQDLGTYINLIYTYGLSIAGILVVVMIMIAGAMYIIGSRGGNTEEVTKAKERISNALIGLVLLLSSYLILSIINPDTVEFKTLQFEKIKPSLFIIGSCNAYEDAGYTVDPVSSGNESCGDTGIVSKNPSGQSMELECTYDFCEDGNRCANVGGEQKCLSCGTVTSEVVDGFTASGANCSQLTPPASDQPSGAEYVCHHIKDVDFNNAVSEAFGNLELVGTIPINIGIEAISAAVESANSKVNGACGLVELNCSNTEIKSCSDYDNVTVSGGDPSQKMAELDSIEDLIGDYCTNDPCGVGPCTLSAGIGDIFLEIGTGWVNCSDAEVIPPDERPIGSDFNLVE